MNKDTKPILDNEPEMAKRTSDVETRSITRGDMTVDKFRTQIGQYNFTNQCSRIWNFAPSNLREATSMTSLKNQMKDWIKTTIPI